ncbi:MAG: 7-cyano-7-deazaguanine synthase, partial [SAR202 cluster bacterium]|nr:7-cyano-7-deazaguanine synthase [SAR202 cluster bacterium]
AARTDTVFPVYIRAGLAWEDEEFQALERFISALANKNVQLVTTIPAPADALYDDHWSVTGDWVPEAATASSALFLPGRNVLLLSLAAIWCSMHGVSRLAIGSLWGNPFPDSTLDFFESFSRSLSLGLAHEISIEAPYRNLNKEEIIQSNADLPLELTLTCMAPRGGVHCGDCNKCEERRTAFDKAGISDRTAYNTRREGA